MRIPEHIDVPQIMPARTPLRAFDFHLTELAMAIYLGRKTEGRRHQRAARRALKAFVKDRIRITAALVGTGEAEVLKQWTTRGKEGPG